MNFVLVTGRVVKNPEIRVGTKSGRTFCITRFCILGEYRGKNIETEVEFVDVLTFGAKAKVIQERLKKGQKALIAGSLRIYDRVDAFGNKRQEYCIICRHFEPLDYMEIKEPIQDLHDSSGNLLIPKEITDSLIRQVDYQDVDIPNDIMERSADDLLKG